MRFSLLEQDYNDYFVGVSEEAILADTANGTQFGGRKYRPGGEVISRDVVEKLDLEYFEEGVREVEEYGVESFLLG